MLTNSILVNVRAMCNVEEDDQGFDKQLIPLINGQIMMAHQFGIGYAGFIVHNEKETFDDLLGRNSELLNAFKIWLGYSVLLLFDPPDNGTVLKSYQDQILKMEWMLCNMSCLEGHVTEYVPSKSKFYEHIGENPGRSGSVYYDSSENEETPGGGEDDEGGRQDEPDED